MKKKLITLLVTVGMAATLSACASEKDVELPKEGTTLNEEVKDKENNAVTAEQANESTDSNKSVDKDSIFIREVDDGYLKEVKVSDSKSDYTLSWTDSLSNNELSIQFSALPDIGSWYDQTTASGVYRCVNEDTWITLAVWNIGATRDSNKNDISLKSISNEEIAKIVNGYNIKMDTIEIEDRENYIIGLVDFESENGLFGSAAIIDDIENNTRWFVQFAALNPDNNCREYASSVTLVDSQKENLADEINEVTTEPLVVTESIFSDDSNTDTESNDELSVETDENN